MHSPTLANDFSFRLTLAFATFQPISFSLRSMPPLQIPCSHTLADSFSLFALFSTLASFVFNNLRTLCAKHRGVGYLCNISAPSAPARSSGGPLRYHLPLSCGPFYFHPLTNSSSSRIDLQHSLFSCTYKSLFSQLLCIHIYTKRPGVTPPHNFSTDGLGPLPRKFSADPTGIGIPTSAATRDVFHTSFLVYPERSRGAFATFPQPVLSCSPARGIC